MAAPAQSVRQFTGVENRRSTRLQRAVRLMIVGQNHQGLPFREKMSTVSLNLHGCDYQSWHDSQLGVKVEMQLMEGMESRSPVVVGRVRSIRPPRSHGELFQIGVEFDTPANIWGITPPPEDWLQVLEGTSTTTELAAAPAPAPEPEQPAAVPAPQTQEPAAPQSGTATPAASPAGAAVPLPAAAAPEPAKEGPPAKLERVTITMDQLIAALQGKLQRAAERAVQAALQTQLEETVKSSLQAAVTSQLDEAVKQSLSKIDELSTANVRQAEAVSAQRLEELNRSSHEGILNHLDARMAELQGRFENQQEASRSQAEEMVQRLEMLGIETRHELAETRKLVEKLAQQPEPQPQPEPASLTHPALEQSISRATEAFEAAATRISDRQLVRLIEDKQMVTRETTSHLEACGAESRALLQSAANSTLEEFRRQLEVQVDLALSESAQRASSSLATLEAENRAACEARRRALEEEVARATGQATEQFRSGIKAFLYASLVAAVGAVDEHAQTTLAGLVSDRGKAPREIGKLPDSPASAENPGEIGGS